MCGNHSCTEVVLVIAMVLAFSLMLYGVGVLMEELSRKKLKQRKWK